MRQQGIQRARDAGFTLIEVLVAFVIFALTLAALLQVFSGGLRDAQLADEYARATMIAQSRLATVTAAERVDEGSSSGKEGEFAWVVAAGPYDERLESADADRSKDYNLRVRLMRVDVKVGWHAADGRDRDVRLATLLLAAKP